MCDRDRASLAYLFLEERNDTAIGAQHVAESGGDELRPLLCLSIAMFAVQELVQGLHVNLADTLGATHDVGRIHCLVR